MTEEIRQKIVKVRELVLRGEQGEKKAAEKALERLVAKYNLSEEEVSEIHLKSYTFKYATDLDKRLFVQLTFYFFSEKYKTFYLETNGVKEIQVALEYVDWVQMEVAYEYFRKHLRTQWRQFALPLLQKKRTTKNKNKLRKELQDAFFSTYIIRSGIYQQEQLKTVDDTKSREAKMLQHFRGIEGGTLRGQVTTGLYLE